MPMKKYLCTTAAFAVALAIVVPLQAADPEPVDYNRDIRPLLSKKCFACHGQDAEGREGGLRLDRRDDALLKGDSDKRAIVPGKANESELIRRIVTDDADQRMPPEGEGDRLTEKEITLLRRWIDQDAPYARHWAFIKPQRHELPKTSPSFQPLNAIDHFVLAKLETEGLGPSQPADRYTLIRRLSLDLRGLPPSPKEVEQFVGDTSANAYEKLVDRFLSDPAYGERWAQMWLDLARYADSKGYGSDPLREIWRYRDWVIDAYNANMPYDQFTTEQIAGDLLPDATLRQRIATAFHRNTMTNTEGGTDDEEFRVAAVRDRVDTTVQVWMGLTMRCGTCHDHKYDPITQQEYYRFYAYLNQTADNDQPNESPTIKAPTPEMEAEFNRLDAEIAKLKPGLETPEVAAAQTRWEADLTSLGEWIVSAPQKISSQNGTTFKELADGSILAEGETPKNETYTVTTKTSLNGIVAVRLEAIPDASLPGGGSGRAKDGGFVLSKFTLNTGDAEVELVRAVADFSQDKFHIESARKQADLAKSGWAVGPKQKEQHTAVFITKTPLAAVPADNVTLTFTLAQQNEKPGQLLGRFRLSVTDSLNVVRRFEQSTEVLAIIDTRAKKRTAEQAAKLQQHFRDTAPSLKPLRDKIAKLEAAKPTYPTLPVLQELPADKRRKTHLMIKGSFLNPGEEVTPAVPAAFHALPADAPSNRLAVAQWLMDKENPLTARVAVNRYWAQLFGTGIVVTEEDFGTQGDPPSHPKLLDWLATEYLRLNWDSKALLKVIVTSATYRQSSLVTEEHLRKDPINRLLTRGPRFRLKAEIVRDQALSLSGLLSRKMRGPSVYPPQPPGLWRAAFNGRDRKWATSTGEDRYRRGMYTFWRRTVPYPSMATFDAPSREVCAVRRIRTNTPLQAFVTMNDPVYVEAAQALGRRIVREGGENVEERLRYALRLCLVRPATEEQVETLLSLYESERAHYLDNEKSAVAIATDPFGPLPKTMPPAEMAAWTVVANVLLNLDAVLSKN